MKKIEFVWRELLERVIEKRDNNFKIIDLAKKFQLSTSVVAHALLPLKELNIIRIGKNQSQVIDWERFLFFWATKRNLKKDIVYKTYSSLPVFEREGLMPFSVIPTAYSAFRFYFKKLPADYDICYFYSNDLEEIKKRFPQKKGEPNIVILKPDCYLLKREEISLPQLFVDIWNLGEWYAKDFQEALLLEIKTRLNQ